MHNNPAYLQFKAAIIKELRDFLASYGITNAIDHYQIGQCTVDLYLPDHSLAIDYHGNYWNSSGEIASDLATSKILIHKTNQCEQQGAAVLHIFESEWRDPIKQAIWKSTIMHKLGQSAQRIWARKCAIVQVKSQTARDFFIKNHLQGHASGSHNVGLVHQGQLVTVAAFVRPRFVKDRTNRYELLRFASLTNCSVVGGFNRLIGDFEKTHSGVLISYANRRWSQGQVYKTCGFDMVKVSGPCYYYTDQQTLWHRSVFQKHKLADQLATFDPNMTEVENMYANHYRRMWDSGNLIFEKTLK